MDEQSKRESINQILPGQMTLLLTPKGEGKYVIIPLDTVPQDRVQRTPQDKECSKQQEIVNTHQNIEDISLQEIIERETHNLTSQDSAVQLLSVRADRQTAELARQISEKVREEQDRK